MKACPVCGFIPVEAEDRYCYKHGARLVDRPTCADPECRRELSQYDRYCASCGLQVAGWVDPALLQQAQMQEPHA